MVDKKESDSNETSFEHSACFVSVRLSAAVVGLCLALVVTACGEPDQRTAPLPTSSDAYFASVSDAVSDYAAELEAVDRDLLAGDWVLPPSENRKESDEFFYTAENEARAGHLDAWRGFIKTLEDLAPPEGIAQLGEGFEEGFPEYIEDGVIAAERAAFDANAAYRRNREGFLDWIRGWDYEIDGDDEYRKRRMAGDELLTLAKSAEDALEDEWEELESFADEVGLEFDGAELRTNTFSADACSRLGYTPSDPCGNLRVSGRYFDSVSALVDALQAS